MSERPLVTMRAEGEARGVKTTVRVGDHTPFIVDERIEALRKVVEARCPVHNLMHAADVAMTAEWTRK